MRRHFLVRILLGYVAVIAVFTVVALVVAGRAAPEARPGLVALVLVTACLLVVASGAISFLTAHVLTQPVKSLTAAFRRISAGDLDVRVLPARQGRLRELGDSFNEMAFRTQELVAELTRQREALNTVIASIQEGLAVLDSSGVIVLANDSFRRICADRDVVGKHYWEAIRDPHVAGLVKAVGPGQSTATRRCDLGGRDYVCSAGFLPAADRLVLTLHDVTEISRTAEVKRDFVQNVSHELRTPLTAIKGFAETMQPTIDEANRPYLETIIRNTDRLVSLVQDLLTLSELEERGTELQVEDVDLKAMAEQILKLFEPRARAKGLVLRLSISSLLPLPSSLLLRADRFKLEQVFINLLDNAVKYTDRGEVELVLGREDGEAVIKVRDTGPGIAPEHLPRLFERFYVVDKGRSRQLGGTGLGLSIVKHIVLLHSGEVTVESTPGAGTTFTITIPVRAA
ncbi:MAG: ATP-binding protein [candidate division WOR-3 bacterium]|nr:ATP-binding protein [candidate division WOR-3 bacterium]